MTTNDIAIRNAMQAITIETAYLLSSIGSPKQQRSARKCENPADRAPDREERSSQPGKHSIRHSLRRTLVMAE